MQPVDSSEPNTSDGTGSPSRSSRKTWVRRGALFLASCSLGLILCELVLRVLGVAYPPFYTWDPDLGSRLRPGTKGWYREEGEAYVRINREGFRDDDHAREKAPGVFRIAILGDSFAEAMQVMKGETFWNILESELRACEKLAGMRIEVMNFSVSGYGTAQELIVLRKHVLEYEPDVVVLAFLAANDVRNNSEALEGDRFRPYFVFEDGDLVLDDSFARDPAFLARQTWKSHVYSSISKRLRLGQLFDHILLLRARGNRVKELDHDKSPPGAEIGLDDQVYKESPTEEWEAAWRVTEALVERIREEVLSAGAEFHMLSVSGAIQVHPDESFRRQYEERLGVSDLQYPSRRIGKLAERLDIPLFDIVGAYHDLSPEGRPFLHGFGEGAWSGHWNQDGHRFAGEGLAESICNHLKGRH